MTSAPPATQPAPAKPVRAQSMSSVAWAQFKKNRLAQLAGLMIILMYLMALFAPFIAPDSLSNYSTTNITKFHPPTPLHIRDPQTGSFTRPFVYQYTQQLNMDTFVNEFKPSTTRCPVYLGVRGDPYKLFGFIPSNIHLFGTGNPDCKVYLLGGETLGRDLFTRILYASQISLTIGLGAVLIRTVLGLLMGVMAAYFGKAVDSIIMRFVEVLASIPDLFLLILLRSIFPQDVNPIFALYMILGILAFIGWGGLARATRSTLVSVRELDFVQAAKALGASDNRIMLRHMLPSMTTYVIVSLSLAIPGAMLTEAGLSFLGIGAVEPYVSWGSLLSQAQEGGFASITQRPWMLIPGFFIVLAVLCFNVLGDGLRDALDPSKRR